MLFSVWREVYERTGELDKGYGLGFFEDNDYCERVMRAGYRMAIVEDAFVYHHGSASFKALPGEEFQTLWERNKRRYEQKWNKRWSPGTAPVSLFSETKDPGAVKERVQAAGKMNVLVLGGENLPVPERRWPAVKPMLIKEEGRLIIAYLYRYYQRNVHGIRKVGPSLYITNRLDLLEQTSFDRVIYAP
ncbi:glycosyltransferase family 2 protein [Paenibacillus tarimensis]